MTKYSDGNGRVGSMSEHATLVDLLLPIRLQQTSGRAGFCGGVLESRRTRLQKRSSSSVLLWSVTRETRVFLQCVPLECQVGSCLWSVTRETRF